MPDGIENRESGADTELTLARQRTPTLPVGTTPGERGLVSVWAPRPVNWEPEPVLTLCGIAAVCLVLALALCIGMVLGRVPEWAALLGAAPGLLLVWTPVWDRCVRLLLSTALQGEHGRRILSQPTYISSDEAHICFTSDTGPRQVAWEEITALVSQGFGSMLLQLGNGDAIGIWLPGYSGRDQRRLVQTVRRRAQLLPIRARPDREAREAVMKSLSKLRGVVVPARGKTLDKMSERQLERLMFNFMQSFARPGVELHPERMLLEQIQKAVLSDRQGQILTHGTAEGDGEADA